MSRTFANLLLVVAAICWGAGNVAQQTVLGHIGPFIATGLKSLIAAIVILPYCLRSTTARKRIDRAGLILGSVVAFSFVAASTLMQIAYGLTTVTNAGFLVNTATVITPIMAWFFLKQRHSRCIWFAAITTLSGAMLMGGGHMSAFSSGDLLSLASAVCFAIWMISLGEFVTRYERAGLITILQFCLTALICLPVGLVIEMPTTSAIMAAAPELLFIGVISNGSAYLLQAIAQRHTSSSEAAVIVSAEAIFGAVAAMLILGEQLSNQRAIGACLIIASIILVQIPSTRRQNISTSMPINQS